MNRDIREKRRYDEFIKKAQENECGKVCDNCDEDNECSIQIDALLYADGFDELIPKKIKQGDLK